MRFWVSVLVLVVGSAVLVPVTAAAVEVEGPADEAYHYFHHDSDGVYAGVYDVEVDTEFEEWGYTLGLDETKFVTARDNADQFIDTFLPASEAGLWDRQVWETTSTPAGIDEADLDRLLNLYGGVTDSVFGSTMDREGLIRAFSDDVFNIDNSGTYTIILGEVSVWSVTQAVFDYADTTTDEPVSTVDAAVLNTVVVEMFGDAEIAAANQTALTTHYGDTNGNFTKNRVAEIFHSETLTFEPANNSTFTVTASTSGLGNAQVWPAFGSFGDNDADGILNNDDTDTTITYGDTFLTASATQELPGQIQTIVNASEAGMADFEAGYGAVVDSRLVSYQTETNVSVFQLVNMDPLSRTYLDVYAQVSETPNGEISLFDDTGAVVELTSEETDQANTSDYDMNAVYDHRRLTNGGTTPGIDAIKTELVAAGITEEFYTGQGSSGDSIDWVEYTYNDTAYATIRFSEITEDISDPSGFYLVKERTEHSFTINEQSAKWDLFNTFKTNLDTFNDPAAVSDNVSIPAGGALTAIGAGQISASLGLAYPFALGTTLPPAVVAMLYVYASDKIYQGTKPIKNMTIIAHDTNAHTTLPNTDTTDPDPDPDPTASTYSEYWIPNDAELLTDPNFVDADADDDDADDHDSPYTVDVMEYMYTLPDEPDSSYMVATDVSDPEAETYGIVLQKVVITTTGDTETVTVYDSLGQATVIDGVDTDATIVQPEPHDVYGIGELDLDHLATLLPDNAEILEEQAAGDIVFIVYSSPDFEGHKMLFAERTENPDNPGHYHYGHATVWAGSEEATRIRTAVELYTNAANTIGFDDGFNGDPTDWTIPKFSSYLLMAARLGYGGGDGGDDGLGRPRATTTRMATLLAAAAANLAAQNIDISVNFPPLFSSAKEYAQSVWNARHPVIEVPETQDPLFVGMALNPTAAAPADAPPDISTAPTTAAAFQAVNQQTTNTIGTNLINNGFGLLPVDNNVNQELTALTAADRTASETRDGFGGTSLLGDAEFNASVTALANSVFGPIATQLGYPQGTTLEPQALNLRTWGQRGGSTTLHQDRGDLNNNALIVAMTLNNGTPMDYVPNEHFDHLEVGEAAHQYTLRPGVSEADVMAQIPNNNIAFFGTYNPSLTTDENYRPLIHRSPAGSEGRSIMLFRFKAILHRLSGG